jgi:hypothetical protein
MRAWESHGVFLLSIPQFLTHCFFFRFCGLHESEFYHTFALLLANNYLDRPLPCLVNSDCVEVDELILELTDYKNDYADVAAEKLLRKCSTSWEAYQYLQDRVHDAGIPDYARQHLRRIIKRIQVQLLQQREYGWPYEQS